MAVMRRLKRELDPQNIMNPGKLVPEPGVGAEDGGGGLRPADVVRGQCC